MPTRKCAFALAFVVLGASCSDYELTRFEGYDTFYQTPADELDILLVVDDSCSMQPYQQELGDNFEAFLKFFIEGDVDYRIGVITTDITRPDAGQVLGEVVDVDTPDAASRFAQIVSVGTQGSGFEMGLESAKLALERPLEEQPLLRSDAALSVIFVTDEEDSSPLPVSDYINAFTAIKGHRQDESFNASSLQVRTLDSCSADQIASGASVGTRYLDVVAKTGGITGDICAPDFSSLVEELSLASSRLTDTFPLSDLPAVASLQVWVDDVEIPCDAGVWRYELSLQDEPQVVFERSELPPPRAVVNVAYDYGAGDPADFCGGDA